jgi:hypothetical protein
LSANRALSASTITHGAGGWLVTGSESVGESEQALVWTSADGVHWERSRSGRFGRAGTYAYSDLTAAVPWHGWVVVGDQSADGLDDQSAIAIRSRDGRAWYSAVNTSRTVSVGGRRVIREDLRGDRNGNRGMTAVVAVGGGLLAVGTAQAARGTIGREAAVWRSADAVRWTLRFLPRGSAQSANAAAVTARGATVVAYGTVQSGTVTKGVIWSSGDAGRTWRLQALPSDGGARAEVTTDLLVPTAGGFVAAGSVGHAGARRPAMWASQTGSTWRPVALTDPRLAAGGDWTLDGVVAAGDRLVGIATRTSPRGSVPIALRQRVP